ncbi:MAG: 4Fe-4S binding protein [Sphingobacteriia bacterium]|nr:4Fe-4S binding protein [Sphingobacteriia bacterium]
MDFDKDIPFCPDCNNIRLHPDKNEETTLTCMECGRNFFYYKGEIIPTKKDIWKDKQTSSSHSLKKHQKININSTDCVLCRACTKSCPHNAIIEDTVMKRLFVKETLCTLCGRCIEVCNYEAISYTTKE